MQARIKWVEERTFVGQSGSGHAVVLDASVENGGRNLGPSPMELVLIGTGGCTAFDVVDILKKGRHAVTDCWVELEAERAAQVPRVFTTHHDAVRGHRPQARAGPRSSGRCSCRRRSTARPRSCSARACASSTRSRCGKPRRLEPYWVAAGGSLSAGDAGEVAERGHGAVDVRRVGDHGRRQRRERYRGQRVVGEAVGPDPLYRQHAGKVARVGDAHAPSAAWRCCCAGRRQSRPVPADPPRSR